MLRKIFKFIKRLFFASEIRNFDRLLAQAEAEIEKNKYKVRLIGTQWFDDQQDGSYLQAIFDIGQSSQFEFLLCKLREDVMTTILSEPNELLELKAGQIKMLDRINEVLAIESQRYEDLKTKQEIPENAEAEV